MGNVFDVYLANGEQPESEAYAELSLPAAPYQMQDALDKVRLAEGEALYWEVTEYHQFEELSTCLSGDCTLQDLNALAQRLAELDEQQRTAFAGLLRMEQKKEGAIPVSRIIDLAYSTDCCHVVDEVLNDVQLGRFCAESGFIPGTEELPDALFDLLDFERIGREHRQREGGVLVERTADHPGGYVERYGELAEAYKTLDLTPKQPDYTILLEQSRRSITSSDGGGTAVQVKLPAPPEALRAALDAAGTRQWREKGWRCLDCRVPMLSAVISGAGASLDDLNRLAQRLADMEPEALTAYKALLELTGCANLLEAGQLMDSLDKYILSPQYSSPTSVAMGELSAVLGQKDAAMLAPHLNLHQYGQSLIEKRGGALTSYGLLQWPGDQPTNTLKESPKQGGMEMK